MQAAVAVCWPEQATAGTDGARVPEEVQELSRELAGGHRQRFALLFAAGEAPRVALPSCTPLGQCRRGATLVQVPAEGDL